MQIFQRSNDLGSIESRVVFRDALARSSLQGSEKFTSTAILHAQVQMLLGLERVVEGDNERVIARGEDFLLSQRSLNLVSFDHLLLAQH